MRRTLSVLAPRPADGRRRLSDGARAGREARRATPPEASLSGVCLREQIGQVASRRLWRQNICHH
jgi:hypothetical protein